MFVVVGQPVHLGFLGFSFSLASLFSAHIATHHCVSAPTMNGEGSSVSEKAPTQHQTKNNRGGAYGRDPGLGRRLESDHDVGKGELEGQRRCPWLALKKRPARGVWGVVVRLNRGWHCFCWRSGQTYVPLSEVVFLAKFSTVKLPLFRAVTTTCFLLLVVEARESQLLYDRAHTTTIRSRRRTNLEMTLALG